MDYNKLVQLITELGNFVGNSIDTFEKMVYVPELPEYKDIVDKRQLYDLYKDEVQRNSRLNELKITVEIKKAIIDDTLAIIVGDQNINLTYRTTWNKTLIMYKNKIGNLERSIETLSNDLSQRLKFMYSLGFLTSSISLADTFG